MRVVVTGGSGFIGTRLLAELRMRGYEVGVVDLVPVGRPGIAMYPVSVLDADATRAAVGDAGAVIHLAGYVRDTFRRDPYGGSQLQIQGTLNVLEACRLNRVPHCLLASSFYVYQGLPATLTVDETTPIDLLATELFGGAKLMAEALCREYTQKYGVQHTILRLGSAYGPGGSNVVRTFIEMGRQGQGLEIWGPGQRRNQYTFVDDLVRGIVAGLDSPNETFNLASPEVTTTATLAELLAGEVGGPVRYDLARREEPSFPCVSSAKAMAKLHWQPTGLREGLAQTLQALGAAGEAAPTGPTAPGAA